MFGATSPTGTISMIGCLSGLIYLSFCFLIFPVSEDGSRESHDDPLFLADLLAYALLGRHGLSCW
jgi:hypothetical protein